MAGLLEPCWLHGGGTLPPTLFAPGSGDGAELYWRALDPSPVVAGAAVEVRGSIWLVESVALWRGRPGGVHAKVRACNATGLLYRRAATVTAYGVTLDSGASLPFVGVLVVSSSSDADGVVTTTADLTPAGTWTGGPGDLLTFDDGSEWEQVGDLLDRSAGGGSALLPVVRLRRVADGASSE